MREKNKPPSVPPPVEKKHPHEVLQPRQYHLDVLILFSAALSPQAAYVRFPD